MSHDSKCGYILHCYHRVHKGREQIYAIGCLDNGESFGIIEQQYRPHFFIRIEELQHAQEYLKNAQINDLSQKSLEQEDVLRISCDTQQQVQSNIKRLKQHDIATYEAELSPSRAWLIDHNIRGAITISGQWQAGTRVNHIIYNPDITAAEWDVSCSLLSLDIETSYDGTNEGEEQCTAISLIGAGTKHFVKEILVLNESDDSQEDHNHKATIHVFNNERELLLCFAQRIIEIDPDIITGWNVIDFDFQFLEQRFQLHNIALHIGRTQDPCSYYEGKRWGNSRMFIPGRQVLDAMFLSRYTLTRYDDYKLETVAQACLGRGKLLHSDSDTPAYALIQEAYHKDRQLFIDYCLEDAQLVLDILAAEDLIALTIKRSCLCGLSLERAWGSIEAFEYLYLCELHKQDIVLRSANEVEHNNDHAPGGYVFPAQAGLHKNILVFDFKSLYPSLIRTFNIDPLSRKIAHIESTSEKLIAPNGAAFAKGRGILPTLLDIFWDKRHEAKQAQNDLASYTYKIVMNSFYGVLGSSGCRLAHPQLAGAITSFGHLILKWTKQHLEEQGFSVLYGDTDSVFVDAHLAHDCSVDQALETAKNIEQELNQAIAQYISDTYHVESLLELEFEKHYHTLLLPPIRGDDDINIGRAKGYAGLLLKNGEEHIDIVGLEAVRRDWTDMAHDFQRGLFDLLFHNSEAAEMESFIQAQVQAIYAGKMDNQLIYRRALRKDVDAYTKTTPPHVKAARLLDDPKGLIHYFMTIHGPQPVIARSSAIDYDHYIRKQLEPIIQSIATYVGIDVERSLSGEQRFL